mmetsp:Transcript_13131/g.31112  ORF Transcript_13131/g.31112 Transcript_13131/m.31112 type:complete len:398 (+) Transcript_13131:219-1412(+)
MVPGFKMPFFPSYVLLVFLLRYLSLSSVQANSQVIHGDKSWSRSNFMNESDRVSAFYRDHGSWPDPAWLENEPLEYSRVLEQRTREVMQIEDLQERWDQWMYLAQARIVPTFTRRQWDVVTVPEEIYRKLYTRFHEMLPKAGFEVDGRIVAGEGPAKFFEQEDLNYEVLHELRPLFSQWAGVEVEPTSVYGVRVYQEGQTLDDHVDVLETHVISGILHIDSDLDEPFPIQILEADGTLASADLKPGQLMFYESAKSFHQRRIPMKGRYYASIFMHYRPVGWNMTREQVLAAIPPWWDARSDPRDEVADDQTPMTVTFVNKADAEAQLSWVVPGSEATSPDGRRQMQPLASVPAGATSHQTTYPGHVIVATWPGGSSQWTMQPRHNKQAIHIGGRSEL